MDLKEIGINTRNWIDSAQDRDYWRALVNVKLNLQVPLALNSVDDSLSRLYAGTLPVAIFECCGLKVCSLKLTTSPRHV